MQLKLYERTMIAGIFAGVSVVDQIIMLIGIAGCYSNSTSSGFYTPSQCQLARSLLFSLATGGSILPLLQLERITPTLVSDCNSCFLKVNRVIPIVLLGALGAFFSLMAYAGGVPSSSSDNNTSFVIWFSGSILSIHATVAAGVLAIRTAYLVRPTWDNSVGNLS